MVHSEEKRLSDNKFERMEDKKNLPSHYAYHVSTHKDKESGEEKWNWKRIGAAWWHDDQQGCFSRIDWFPKGGEIVFRPVPVKDNDSEAELEEEKFLARLDAAIESSMPEDWQK